jgi:DNA-binding response OmpR family regulator
MIKGPRSRGSGRVLVVVSSPALARTVRLALQHAALQVRTVSSAAEARAVLRRSRPHLAVVDASLTREISLSEFGDVAAGNRPPPVIALATVREPGAVVNAFDWGVDDFMASPICPEELLARVRAVIRRAHQTEITFTPTITVGRPDDRHIQPARDDR